MIGSGPRRWKMLVAEERQLMRLKRSEQRISLEKAVATASIK
jgi:hypothetical protein